MIGSKFIILVLHCHFWGFSTAVSMGRPSSAFSLKKRGMQVMDPIQAKMTNMVDKVVAAGPRSEKIMPYPYETYQLGSNGLEVIIVPLGDDFPGYVC